jgi:FkbM family methyltransferase
MQEYINNINFNYNTVKLDIGLSNNAPHSKIWLDNDKNSLVIGFEPNLESINNIISKHHISHEYINTRFFMIPIALFNVDNPTNMEFNVMHNDCGCSSLYKPLDPVLGQIKHTIQVPVYSLKHFFDLFPWDKIERIDYIKIDAQGADFDIIKSAGSYLKDRVVYITAEPESNQYEGCFHNNVDNMTNYLISQNFIRINHPNTNDPTFVNKKFLEIAKNIYINQFG